MKPIYPCQEEDLRHTKSFLDPLGEPEATYLLHRRPSFSVNYPGLKAGAYSWLTPAPAEAGEAALPQAD